MGIKTAIFKGIFPNFTRGKYWSTGDLFVNNNWTPTISIAQTKIPRKNILKFINDTKVPSVLKLQDSDVGSEVQKYPKKNQSSAKVIGK